MFFISKEIHESSDLGNIKNPKEDKLKEIYT